MRRLCSRNILHGFLLSLLLVPPPLVSVAALADTPSPDLNKLSIEQLMDVEIDTVYGASRYEQKVTEAPSSVSIVTREDIERYGYRTLTDLLKGVRGFYVSYDRNYIYVGVRGFGRTGDYNNRILLLVDGHRINDNIYDSAQLGTDFPVDLDLIDRVEIIRGPGSSLYGSNAFFAVINVITRQGEDLGGVEMSAETGNSDTYKGRVTYGESFNNGIETLISGTYYDSNGDRLFFKEFATPANNNGITDHTDYDRSYNTLAKISYRGFTLEGAYSSRTKGIPTASYATDFNDRRNRTIDSTWYTDLKYSHSFGNSADVSGRLFFDGYDYNGDYVYSGTVNKDLARGRWWGGEMQTNIKLFDSHKLIAGTEYRDNIRQDQRNFNESPFTSYLDDRRDSRIWAAYLQDEFSIFNNLILNAGVRYDHYSTFGSTINPRFALIYTPFAGTVFKFLYGNAFRAPNVFELYYDIPSLNVKGNPDLGPEKIRTYELICEQYIGSRLRGTISGFYYNIDNLIVQVTDPADGFAVFRNLSKAQADGVEAELEAKFDNGLTGRASYSFQDAWDSDTGETLVNSPRHLAKLNITIPLLKEKVFLGIEEQFTDRRKTLVAGNFAKSYFVTNLTMFSHDLLKNLELSASLYNLFDYRYGDPGGAEHIQDPARFADPAHPLDVIQQDGRSFRVKLTYRF